MELKILSDAIMNILNTPFVLMGFTLTFFEVLLYLFILALAIILIGGILR